MKKVFIYLIFFLFINCAKDRNESIIEINDINQNFSLTVIANSGGSVSPSSGSYSNGSQISILASPISGYTFSGWSNGSIENPIILTKIKYTNSQSLMRLVKVKKSH